MAAASSPLMSTFSSSASTFSNGNEPALSALLNSLVLDKIARCLPPRDLLHLRRTATVWNQAFIPALRKTAAPILLGHCDCSSNVYEEDSRHVHSICLYTIVMTRSQCIPYGRYWLIGTHFQYNRKHSRNSFDEFVSLCGPTISCLKISSRAGGSHCGLPNRELRDNMILGLNLAMLRQIIAELTPNLQELELDMPVVDGAHNNILALTALGNHSSAVYKLKVLNLHHAKKAEVEILTQLALRGRNPLRLVDFTAAVDREQSNAYVQNVEALSTFLSTQSDSLRHLSLDIGYHDGDDSAAPRVRRVLAHPGRFDLGGTLPLLKSLTLNWTLIADDKAQGLEDNLFHFRVLDQDHSGVTDLCLTHASTPRRSGRRCSQEIGWRLAELGRNLRAVTRFVVCVPSDYIPHCIWTTWPLLNVLHIEYSPTPGQVAVELDEWLTGIPAAWFPLLGNGVTAKDNEDALDCLRTLHRSCKSLPGITDLNFLRSFKLIVSPEHDVKMECSLTDFGGYFGLALASPCLQHLVVRYGKQEIFSDACKSIIRNSLGPYAVIELN